MCLDSLLGYWLITFLQNVVATKLHFSPFVAFSYFMSVIFHFVYEIFLKRFVGEVMSGILWDIYYIRHSQLLKIIEIEGTLGVKKIKPQEYKSKKIRDDVMKAQQKTSRIAANPPYIVIYIYWSTCFNAKRKKHMSTPLIRILPNSSFRSELNLKPLPSHAKF